MPSTQPVVKLQQVSQHLLQLVDDGLCFSSFGLSKGICIYDSLVIPSQCKLTKTKKNSKFKSIYKPKPWALSFTTTSHAIFSNQTYTAALNECSNFVLQKGCFDFSVHYQNSHISRSRAADRYYGYCEISSG